MVDTIFGSGMLQYNFSSIVYIRTGTCIVAYFKGFYFYILTYVRK